jgi:hypothetical protein
VCFCVRVQDTESDVEADYLSGWHVQLVVNSGLQVLIKQCFELLILLIEESRLFN